MVIIKEIGNNKGWQEHVGKEKQNKTSMKLEKVEWRPVSSSFAQYLCEVSTLNVSHTVLLKWY